MSRLANPLPIFLDGRGALLDAGYIYIGTVNTDPEILANQLPLFWDAALYHSGTSALADLGRRHRQRRQSRLRLFQRCGLFDHHPRCRPNLVDYIKDSTGTGATAISAARQRSHHDLRPSEHRLMAWRCFILANQAALQGAVGVGNGGPSRQGHRSSVPQQYRRQGSDRRQRVGSCGLCRS
jgi:hypothetical protein